MRVVVLVAVSHMPKLRAGKFVVESLLNEGVEYLFGIPGGGVAPFFNEFYDYPQIKTILTQHEQGAEIGRASCRERV